MNILFYRYGSIYEPDMISAFNKAGLNVIEVSPEIANKQITSSDRLKAVEARIKEYDPLFVYGINFYPVIARLCNIYNIMYISQTVDSPILTLFDKAIKCDTNRVFLFDREQYRYFSPFNNEGVFHLPLASATERFDEVIKTISPKDRTDYSCDISFVGSTYREKDPLLSIKGLSDYTKGYVSALVDSTLRIYGYYPVKDALPATVVEDIKKAAGKSFPYGEDLVADIDKYIVSHEYIGSHIAVVEREQTLNTLARYFSVHLFTRSDTSGYNNVHIHDGVRTLDQMPKVFNLSKINLNITMRPIESGLPLRCFDILGCGGFLMTNYQSEIEDMFVIGQDLETYSSLDELVDKCSYYLIHEEERAAIARSGYEKVCSAHTHYHRLKEMLSKVLV